MIERKQRRRGADRRETGRRLDERRRRGYGEIIPDRRSGQRRLTVRRVKTRRLRRERRV